MRKRNKIRLPSLKDADNDSTRDENNRVNLVMLHDDFNDEDPLPLVGGLKKVERPQIKTKDDYDSNAEREYKQYDDLYKKSTKVLNLEDLDLDQKEQSQETFQPKTNNFKKDYVKLLEKEEKEDLLDYVKKTTGDDDDDYGGDKALEEFDDDRLALSLEENARQHAMKRKFILHAITETDQNDSDNREWEANLMNRVQIPNGPTLPPLYEGLIQEDVCEVELTKVKQRTKQLEAQLFLLNKQKYALQQKKDELISGIRQLGTH